MKNTEEKMTRSSRLARAGFIGALLAMAACGSGQTTEHVITHPAQAVALGTVGSTSDASRTAPRILGTFKLTFYHIATEGEVAEAPVTVATTEPASIDSAPGEAVASDAILATTTSEDLVTIYDVQCQELAKVGRRFAAHMDMQGTGKLRNGRVLNVAKHCDCPRRLCYREITGVKWGYAGTGRSLMPFRTIAVDPKRVKLGSALYIRELDGMRMPGQAPWGGFVHDGCVFADDTGGGIRGDEIDFFVARASFYRALSKRGGSHKWSKQVHVEDGAGRCSRSGVRQRSAVPGAS